MRSNEILTAIMCTVAHLESVQAAPVADLSPVADKRDPKINWVGLGEDALGSLTTGVSSSVGGELGTQVIDGIESMVSHYARAPEKQTREVEAREVDGKRSPDPKLNWIKLAEEALEGLTTGVSSAAGSSGATEVMSGVESMASNSARALENRAPRKSSSSSSSSSSTGTKTTGGIGSTIVGGLGSLAGGYIFDEAVNAVESLLPRAPNEYRDAAGMTEEQRRSLWGTLGKDALKGLGTGALKTVGEEAWDAVESILPRAPGDIRDASGKLSTRTDDAPMAARSGVVDEIEKFGKEALPYVEDALPVAATLLDFVKREDGSNTNSARSEVVDDIEEFGKEALPYVEDALPVAATLLDFVKREDGSSTYSAPKAARSGVVDDLEDFGKKALPYVEEALPYAADLLDLVKREDGSN